MAAFRTVNDLKRKKKKEKGKKKKACYTESLNKSTYLRTRTEEECQHVGATLERL